MTQYELESEIVRRDIELRHQRARVERLEALLREALPHLYPCRDTSDGVELLKEIREVLG